jgi:hypothetical protein
MSARPTIRADARELSSDDNVREVSLALFRLPEVKFSTTNHDTFNYAPVAVGVGLAFSEVIRC